MVNEENKGQKEQLNTEQTIIDAARRVFIRKGFAGARMQEIADESGINKALVHYYFRSKEKLFEIIFKESFVKLLPELIEIFKTQDPITEKIKKFTGSYIETLIRHPYIPVFVLSEMHRNPDQFFESFVHPEIQTGLIYIRQSFLEAIQKGEILPIDPRQLIINMMSLCAFPFVAKPMLQRALSLAEEDYEQMMRSRVQSVSEFIIAAITPKPQPSETA